MNQLRGKFIVLDGGEGCGKSTQAQLLKESLENSGVATLLVRDPGSTRIGEMIRKILLDPDNREMSMRLRNAFIHGGPSAADAGIDIAGFGCRGNAWFATGSFPARWLISLEGTV